MNDADQIEDEASKTQSMLKDVSEFEFDVDDDAIGLFNVAKNELNKVTDFRANNSCYLILLLARSVFASLSLSLEELPLALAMLGLADRFSSSISFLSTSESGASFFFNVGVCGAGVEEVTGRGGSTAGELMTTGVADEATGVGVDVATIGNDSFTADDTASTLLDSFVVVYMEALRIDTKFSVLLFKATSFVATVTIVGR